MGESVSRAALENSLYFFQEVNGKGQGIGAIGKLKSYIGLGDVKRIIENRKAADPIADDLALLRRYIAQLAIKWQKLGLLDQEVVVSAKAQNSAQVIISKIGSLTTNLSHRTVLAEDRSSPSISRRSGLGLGIEEWSAPSLDVIGGKVSKNPKGGLEL